MVGLHFKSVIRILVKIERNTGTLISSWIINKTATQETSRLNKQATKIVLAKTYVKIITNVMKIRNLSKTKNVVFSFQSLRYLPSETIKVKNKINSTD